MAGQIPSKPYTFPPADNKIKSSEVNSNFDTLYNMFDPASVGIYDLNIHASADIAATKIKDTALVRTPSGLATPITQNILAAGQAYAALSLQAGDAAPTENVLKILNLAGSEVAGIDYLGYLKFGTDTAYIRRDGDNLKFRDVNLGAVYTLQDLVSSGVAADAAQTTKGISYLSLDPVVAATPIAVGDNDARIQYFQVREAVSGSALKIDVGAGIASVQGVRIEYAGVTDQAVVDDATNYVEIDAAGTLAVNQSAFTAGKMPLATVVAASGSISSVTNDRPYTGFMDIAAAIAWAGAFTFNGNISSGAINADFTSATYFRVPAPAADSDAATKLYVDTSVSTITTRSYTAENIVNEGDMVVISSADKVRRYSPKIGTSMDLATATELQANASQGQIFKLDDTRTVFAGWAVAGAVTGSFRIGALDTAETDFTYGAVDPMDAAAASVFAAWMAKLTASLLVWIYRSDEATDELVVRAGTVSGNETAQGTEVKIEDNDQTGKGVGIVRLSDTTAVIGYSLNSTGVLQLRVISVSGTTVTVNDAVAASSANTVGHVRGMIMFDATNGMILYQKASSGVYYASLFTISGTTPTWGNELEIAAGVFGDGGWAGLIGLSSDTAVVALSEGNAVEIYHLTTDGSDLTKGAVFDVADAEIGLTPLEKVSEQVFAFTKAGDSGGADQKSMHIRFLEVSGTTITDVDATFDIGDSTDTSDRTYIASLVPGKYVVWSINDNRARIVTCDTYIDERIGVAQTDAAKDASVAVTLVYNEASEWTGLTAASRYYVGDDARPTLLTTGVTNDFGTSINTTNIMLR